MIGPAGGPPASVPHGVAVSGYERVEVDEVGHAVADVRKGGGDDGTAVGEADQDDGVEIFVEHVVDDVGHVRAQADARAGQVHTLADAGQARRVRLVARLPQRSSHEVEAVGAAPRPVHQHERRHAQDTTSRTTAREAGGKIVPSRPERAPNVVCEWFAVRLDLRPGRI